MARDFIVARIKETNILVVDDDKDLADNLAEYLATLGFKVTVTYGGREGLDKFKQGDFQLVITDLKMPEMDGMELLESLKSLDSNANVLIITGYATIESAVEAMKKGAHDFITKPFKMEEIEAIVSRALERRTLFHRLGIFRKKSGKTRGY